MLSADRVQYVPEVRYVRVPNFPSGVQCGRRGLCSGRGGDFPKRVGLHSPHSFSNLVDLLDILDEASVYAAFRASNIAKVNWTRLDGARPVGAKAVQGTHQFHPTRARARDAQRAAASSALAARIERNLAPRGRRGPASLYPPQQGGNSHSAIGRPFPLSVLNAASIAAASVRPAFTPTAPHAKRINGLRALCALIANQFRPRSATHGRGALATEQDARRPRCSSSRRPGSNRLPKGEWVVGWHRRAGISATPGVPREIPQPKSE